MMVDQPEQSPGEVRKLAQEWFDRQLQTLKLAHGDRWPEHEEWLRDYLKEELRQRLLKRGWRPKR